MTAKLTDTPPLDLIRFEIDPLSEETQPSLRRIQKQMLAEAIRASSDHVDTDPLLEETLPRMRRIQKPAYTDASQPGLAFIAADILSEET